MPQPAEVDERLQAHLRSWLGAWPAVRPVPLYLDDAADVASARAADASGFADVGGRIFGLFGVDPGTA